MSEDQLDPSEVAEAKYAIIDPGIPGVWPPVIDPRMLIARMWRGFRLIRDRVAELRGLVLANADETVAIELTLGINPQGAHQDVAARLSAIEARLTALEPPAPPAPPA